MIALHSIPYGHQDISRADIDAVVDVLQSDWLTQGPAIKRFERAVADYCGARYAVATCNATAALHLACRALGLGPSDVLWSSPNTFVASANCGLYVGANVDFVDIDPKTYNLCPHAFARKLKLAASVDRLPKVVVPVDFSGQPCEMEAIAELAREYGVRIIEDACHAIGADYRGQKVGNCAFADVTVFSFHPVKIITTGEGGMILTNNTELHRELLLLRNHGITRDEQQMTKASEGPWYYEQVALGYNYRMTDIQAALGISQLLRVNEFVERRRYLARRYTQALQGLPMQLPWQHPDGNSSWHLYVIKIDSTQTQVRRHEVVERLRAAGILVNVHYIPVHLQPYYREMGFQPGVFPNAEAYYQAAISLPIYYGLTEEQQDFVIAKLKETLQ